MNYIVTILGLRIGRTTGGAAVSAASSTPESTSWTYDALGQVETEDQPSTTTDRAYQYDHIGNRKKSANSLSLPEDDNYTSNALNQYTSITSGQLTSEPQYDFDGNMTHGPHPADPTITALFLYDAENRLLEIRNATTGVTLQSNHYDAFHRLIRVTARHNGQSTTEHILWKGWTLVSRFVSSGNNLSETFHYTWGKDLSGSEQGAGGVGGLLAITRVPVTGDASTRYPLYDGNGNITALVTTNGTLSASYQYDSFGNTISATDNDASGWVNHNIHGFSTKPTFGHQGLHYYGYRWYNSKDGRWINRDPIEERGGLNLYGFVGNDGVNMADVLGLDTYPELKPDPNLPRGMTPIGKDGIPKIEKCNIYIFLTHRYDVEMGGLIESVFDKIDKEELMAKDENPCARVSFLSCFTNLSNKDVKTYLDRTQQNSIDNIFLPIEVDNQMLTVHPNPDFPGDTGKAMLLKAREDATKEASELCKCKCSCKSVNIHIYIYGLHWLHKQSLAPDKAAPIQAIHSGAEQWKKYFETINVPCENGGGSPKY